jgi:hypothetical protein
MQCDAAIVKCTAYHPLHGEGLDQVREKRDDVYAQVGDFNNPPANRPESVDRPYPPCPHKR